MHSYERTFSSLHLQRDEITSPAINHLTCYHGDVTMAVLLYLNFSNTRRLNRDTIVSSQLNVQLRILNTLRLSDACVANLAIIGSNNGLSPGRCQVIIWTNDEMLLIVPWGKQILIEIYTFSFKKNFLWKCRLQNDSQFVSASMLKRDTFFIAVECTVKLSKRTLLIHELWISCELSRWMPSDLIILK